MVLITLLTFIILIASFVPFVLGMADDTLQGTKNILSIQRAGPVPRQDQLAVVRVNGATTKLGLVMTHNGETFPDVAPAVTTDISWAGIAYDVQNLKSVLDVDPDWDIDDVVPDNQEIILAKKGSELIVPLMLQAIAGPIAVAKGDFVAMASEAGKVRKWTYTDAVAATDSFLEVIGTVHEANAGSAADDKVIWVNLNV